MCDSIFTLKTQKNICQHYLKAIKYFNLLNLEYEINFEEENVFIPLLKENFNKEIFEHYLEENLSNILDSNSYELIEKNTNFFQIKINKKKIITPHQKIISILKDQFNLKQEILNLIPNRWEKLGDIIILKEIQQNFVNLIEKDEELKEIIGNRFLESLKVRTITYDLGTKIQGELRTPTNIVLLKTKEKNEKKIFKTIHIENKIKYFMNISLVMFSPGNGTERIRFYKMICNRSETGLDMFSGIGYFTIPFLKNNPKLHHMYCIEKNQNSFKFLNKNLKLNNIGDNKVTTVLGDNREQLSSLYGTIDRVLMGYLPEVQPFLFTALSFLKFNTQTIIHYHHLSSKQNFEKQAILDMEQTILENNLQNLIQFEISNFVIVKSYAPKIFHVVADFTIVKKQKLN